MRFLRKLLSPLQDVVDGGEEPTVLPQNNEMNYDPQGFGYVNSRGRFRAGMVSPTRIQPRTYNPAVPNDFSNMEESPLQGGNNVRGRFLGVQPTRNRYSLQRLLEPTLDLPADYRQFGMEGLEFGQPTQIPQPRFQEKKYLRQL